MQTSINFSGASISKWQLPYPVLPQANLDIIRFSRFRLAHHLIAPCNTKRLNYMAFRDTGGNRPGFFERFGWFDMSRHSLESCPLHEIPVNKNWPLFPSIFSLSDYRMLFTGADESDTGRLDLFLLDFDPASPSTNIVNITSNSSQFADDVGVSPAIWASDGSIFTLCTDRQVVTKFCSVDPENGNIVCRASYTKHITDYQLSPSGEQVLTVVINHNALGKGILEIHLFDLNGDAGPTLVIGRMFDIVAMSPSEQYLAYVPEFAAELNPIDLFSGNATQIYTSTIQWSISWAGWVR